MSEHLAFTLAVQTAQGPQLTRHQAPAGSTVLAALAHCGITIPPPLTLGVWGHSVKPQQVLKAGDRVEAYLPLIADPKDARRARVKRSIAQQAAKDNAANRATNQIHRLRREARAAQTSSTS